MGYANLLKTAGRLNTKDYITLSLLDRPGFFHFFGTKDINEKRARDLNACPFFYLEQVHGDTVVQVGATAPSDEDSPAGGVPPRWGCKNETGDALMTDQAGFLMTVSTADCLPVIIIDPNRGAVAIAHAGWRGSLLQIAEKTVSAMTKAYGSQPNTLIAGIGPCIGPCCFEVGREVWEGAERQSSIDDAVIVSRRGEKANIDLARLNFIQLVKSGLLPDNIQTSGLCTVCHPKLFNSYRRDKVRGNNMVSGVRVGATAPGGITALVGAV
jgi:YfiH family protein